MANYVITGEFLDAMIENDILDLADDILADTTLSNADKRELLGEVAPAYRKVSERREAFTGTASIAAPSSDAA